MKKVFLVIPVVVVLIGAFFWTRAATFHNKTDSHQAVIVPPAPKDVVKAADISAGDVYSQVMEKAGIESAIAAKIYVSAKPVYDLAKIKAGGKIDFIYDAKTGDLKKVMYKVSTEDQLTIDVENGWIAELKPIPYEVKIKTVKGEVKTSMYAAALESGIDERAIVGLADVFQWTIDFAIDPRVGDTYSMVYEERYLDGQYVMPGNILAGRYINDGQPYELYYFKESEKNEGYFDEKGNSTQKIFLKAPVSFKYITSGFTYGTRIVSEFGLHGPHRAIDYAAPLGSPIRAVGDGVVTRASWSPVGYGNLTSIRHNGTYSTNYAHQSKFLVKVGQHVKQGQVIGLVGSTGFSTGPHLHFEMVKNGAKINPLKEVLPPGQPIAQASQGAFQEVVSKYKPSL